MPRPRIRPANQYLQSLIAKKGYSTLKDAALGLDISYHTMTTLANLDDSSRIEIGLLKEVADKFGVEPHKFIAGLISAQSKSA